MSTHRHLDRICGIVLVVSLLLTVLFMFGEELGIQKASSVAEYADKLFNTEKVHSIEIFMDDWDGFLENCAGEEYETCSVVIDNESFKNVAIRGKGNSSLAQVGSYGNNRYSFKIEFDRYDSANTYYGLDKLVLNNIIQDNTYMKDYLVYQMMREMDVPAPQCSFAYIKVNGEEWGLYLAVEGVEEAFLERNYGKNYGNLYKPDAMQMGGGGARGEGGNAAGRPPEMPEPPGGEMPEPPGGEMPEPPGGEMPEPPREFADRAAGENPPAGEKPPAGENQADTAVPNFEDGERDRRRGGFPGGFGGQDDVKLKYIDDDIDSYSNIFESAKTEITESDKRRLIDSLKRLSSRENLADTVDIDQVIRYFTVHNFVLNSDSYTGNMIHNYYLYEKDGRLQMIPWDYNLAFGGFQRGGNAAELINSPIDSPVSGGDMEDRPMVSWIFSDESYIELYHQYFREFLSAYFDSGRFAEMMDEVTAMIAPYVEKDPTKFCTYEEFRQGVKTLKEFCLLRAESVAGQLDGSIGSTADTQNADTFVDAGDLQVSAMSTMGGRGERDGFGRTAGEVKPFGEENNASGKEAEEPNEKGIIPGGGENLPHEAVNAPEGNIPGGAGKNFGGGRQMPPGGMGGGAEPSGGTSRIAWIWTGISGGVLLLGLCIAFLFKRRP